MKKLLSFALLLTIIICSPFQIFAQNTTPDTNDDIAQEILDFAKQTGQEIIEDETGVYTVGDETFIDCMKFESSDLGQPVSFDGAVPINDGGNRTRASRPPSTGTVWNWGKGAYSGNIDYLSERVFTNYRFSGYANYTVTVRITGTPNLTTTGVFSVQMLDDKNLVALSRSCTNGKATLNFLRVNPSKKYCFAVAKPKDGFYVTGSIGINWKK